MPELVKPSDYNPDYNDSSDQGNFTRGKLTRCNCDHANVRETTISKAVNLSTATKK